MGNKTDCVACHKNAGRILRHQSSGWKLLLICDGYIGHLLLCI